MCWLNPFDVSKRHQEPVHRQALPAQKTQLCWFPRALWKITMGTNIGFTFILIRDTGAIYLKHYVETMRKGLASGEPIILVRAEAVSI